MKHKGQQDHTSQELQIAFPFTTIFKITLERLSDASFELIVHTCQPYFPPDRLQSISGGAKKRRTTNSHIAMCVIVALRFFVR